MAPQDFQIFLGKLEHEILGEKLDVTLYHLIENFSFHTIQHSQVSIQHDLHPPYRDNATFYIELSNIAWVVLYDQFLGFYGCMF